MIGSQLNNLRRQTVPCGKPVRHNKVNLCSHSTQGSQANCTSGGSVAIIVSHNKQAFACLYCVSQGGSSQAAVRQCGGRLQPLPAGVCFCWTDHSPGSPQACQQGVDAGAYQCIGMCVLIR